MGKPAYKKQRDKKVFGKKSSIAEITDQGRWKVIMGKIISKGKTSNKYKRLFTLFAEKIPIELLNDIKRKVIEKFGKYGKVEGVYVLHDSMSYPRYVVRGDIFGRIISKTKKHLDELKYFSFYVIESKKHERELETLLVHVTGALLQFNERKKRLGTKPGNVLDFERETYFLELQNKRGKKKNVKRKK
jgi:hypothetical protein